MRVRIKTWDQMIEEFGVDSFECPEVPAGFLPEMEDEMPLNRIINVRPELPHEEFGDFYVWETEVTHWAISDAMIEEFIDSETERPLRYDNVTRFEVIDEKSGRTVVRHGVKIRESLQDDGRTLKIFIEKREE